MNPYMKRTLKGESLAFTIAVIALLMMSVIMLRESSGSPVYPLGDSYYSLRIAGEISRDPFLDQDPVQQRPYYPNAYHYFLAAMIWAVGESNTVYLAPVLLGCMSAALLYWLLRNMGLPSNNANLSSLLLAAAPAFIAIFSNLSTEGFVAFLSLLTLCLYFEKDYWDYPWKLSGRIYYGLSIFSLSALALTSLFGFVMTMIFLLALSFLAKRPLRSLTFALAGPVVVLIPVGIFTEYLRVSLASTGFHPFDLRQSFSIFGAGIGLDLFLLLLFATGLIIIWGFIKALRPYHLFSIGLVAASLFNPIIRVYASMVITVYCVVAIKHLYYRKWELEIVKSGTVILLACALVFSAVNQINALANMEPGPEAADALAFLKSGGGDVVFTEPSYGSLIQYSAGKRTMLDSASYLYPDYEDKLGDYRYTLGLTPLKEAEPMMIKHNISYILITPAMKERVWGGKERNLLLLLRNSAKFTEAYETPGGFEVWEYVGARPDLE